MKHLFLPYELAVMAHNKGFRETCLRFWLQGNQLIQGETNIPAPIYQQIVDWLREEHSILILLIKEFEYYVFECHFGDEYQISEDDDYYVAFDEIIEKAIKLID